MIKDRTTVYLTLKAKAMYDVMNQIAGKNMSQEISNFLLAKYNPEEFQRLIDQKQAEVDQLRHIKENIDDLGKPYIKPKIQLTEEQMKRMRTLIGASCIDNPKFFTESIAIFNKEYGTNIQTLKELNEGYNMQIGYF